MALTYELLRNCLNNADDAGGLWQIEVGKVLQGKTRRRVAKYSILGDDNWERFLSSMPYPVASSR